MKKEKSLVHIPALKMASLKTPTPGVEFYLRRLDTGFFKLEATKIDKFTKDLQIPKGTKVMKENNNADK